MPVADTALLQKPFTPDTLAREVRAVLDGTGGPRVTAAPTLAAVTRARR